MRAVPALLVALLVAPPAPAQITAAEYAARRDSLAAHLDSGIVLAFGGRDPVAEVAFVQIPAFAYLTGFDEPDAAFVLVKRAGRVQSVLFTEPRSPVMQIFVGHPADSAMIVRRTGLTAHRGLATLRPFVDSLLEAGLPLYTLRDYETADALVADSLTRGARFVEALRAAHPALVQRDAHPIVNALRERKSPAELQLVTRAASISVSAHRLAMRALRPGMFEYELQSVIEGEFLRQGARPGYPSIVGSGPNGTTLHYNQNHREMRDGETVVIDAAAAFESYSADLTRTLPVSGTFTPEQRAIYQIVREAQAAAEKVVRPGASVRAWNDTAVAVIARGLAKLGLVDSAGATFDPPWPPTCDRRLQSCSQAGLFMPHGLGHGLGLEVHDRLGEGDGAFKVGDVFTIEPGIYISTSLFDLIPDTPRNRAWKARVLPIVRRYENTGVRIEDDYALTAHGLVWLTPAPRELADVEAMMRVRPLTP